VKVARWGNSLAVRLPRSVVEALGLREGDEVEISQRSPGDLEVSRDRRREEALARIRAARWPLPPGYNFNREEIYEQRGFKAGSDESDGR
jgi:antitoxin MazE